MMRERKQHPEWDQQRHVAFICDEYQAIIDPVSDGDFWDKSRSTKTVGIVSMQGVASLTQALGGTGKRRTRSCKTSGSASSTAPRTPKRCA
jgi:hypothetical protein